MRRRRFLNWALWILPAVFFGVCYFLLTATEEDIVQGAGTAPDVWSDLVKCFFYNARLADMYAWAVINFFDYQYSFGIDTIFRLLDVIAALVMLWLMVRIAVGEKVKFELKNALVLAGIFLMIFLTPFGYTLYRGFSMIHNYLIISLAALTFAWPFLCRLRGVQIPRFYGKWWVGLAVGMTFGLSANFPPLAFIASYVVILGWRGWKMYAQRQRLSLSKIWAELRPKTWEVWMMGGMLVSLVIGYGLGPGLSAYAGDALYVQVSDFVPLTQLMADPSGMLVTLTKHLLLNFGRVLAPIAVFMVLSLGGAWVRAKVRGEKLTVWPQNLGERRMIGGILLFCMFVILAGTQIIMPVRLGLVAYLGMVIIVAVLSRTWWQDLSAREMTLAGSGLAVVILAVIAVRGFLAWDFHERVGTVLDKIRETDVTEPFCVDMTQATQRLRTPANIFQQEETFVVRSTTSQVVYGKTVVYCAR